VQEKSREKNLQQGICYLPQPFSGKQHQNTPISNYITFTKALTVSSDFWLSSPLTFVTVDLKDKNEQVGEQNFVYNGIDFTKCYLA
jgi:hypothetical protein